MAPNLLETLAVLLIVTLLIWLLKWDFLLLRRDQKWALYTLLLLAALVSLTAYVCRDVVWKPGADLWLAGLLILAAGGLALWLAQRME